MSASSAGQRSWAGIGRSWAGIGAAKIAVLQAIQSGIVAAESLRSRHGPQHAHAVHPADPPALDIHRPAPRPADRCQAQHRGITPSPLTASGMAHITPAADGSHVPLAAEHREASLACGVYGIPSLALHRSSASVGFENRASPGSRSDHRLVEPLIKSAKA
jgi:hypothetical protein